MNSLDIEGSTIMGTILIIIDLNPIFTMMSGIKESTMITTETDMSMTGDKLITEGTRTMEKGVIRGTVDFGTRNHTVRGEPMKRKYMSRKVTEDWRTSEELRKSNNSNSVRSASSMELEHPERPVNNENAQFVNRTDDQYRSMQGEPMDIERLSAKKNEISFRLCSWNARSIVSKEKLELIEGLDGNILCIQETWLNADTKLFSGGSNWNVIRFDREGPKKAGGTLTLLDQGVVTRRIRVSTDYGFFKVAYAHHSFWVANVYLPTGSKSQIRELFYNIEKHVPREDMKKLFVIGDFNVNLDLENDRLTLLTALAKELNLVVHRPCGETRVNSTLDYLLAPRGVEVCMNSIATDLSDHKVVVVDVTLPKGVGARNIRVINKGLATEVTKWALDNASCAREFLANIDSCRKKFKRYIYTTLNRRQVERKLYLALLREQQQDTRTILNQYWESLIEENENLRYSIKSREAFQFLSRVYKYNQFEKRDGAIVTCVKVNNDVERDEHKVNKLVMDNLRRIQVDERFPMYQSPFHSLRCLC